MRLSQGVIAPTHPTDVSLSLSVFRPPFSTSKIWYQHRLPPVSLRETELTGFLMERWGRADCQRWLWCVCGGLSGGLWLYSYTVVGSSPHELFSHVSWHAKRQNNCLPCSPRFIKANGDSWRGKKELDNCLSYAQSLDNGVSISKILLVA